MMDKKQKRRYAKTINRIEAGAYGEKVSKLKAIHLTTREGDDNSIKRIKKDIKVLMAELRKRYKVEYVFGIGETPDKGLIHTHGLLRIKGGFLKLYEGPALDNKKWWKGKDGKRHTKHKDANRRALGDLWNEIHGAFAVELDDVVEIDYIKKYMSKHIIKDFMVIENNRLLISKKWSHREHEQAIKQFKSWWIRVRDLPWLDSEGWKIIHKLKEAFYVKREVLIHEVKSDSYAWLKKMVGYMKY